MASGPHAGDISLSSLDKDVRLSSWLPDVDVAGAQHSSWGHLCFTWLYMAAKLSHVEADVNRLAFPPHHPTICG
jgi:hypothetical protein